MTGKPEIDEAPLARAMVMLSRYSADITRIAVQQLGRGAVENRDIQFLLAVHDTALVTPTGLAAATGTAPSQVSRVLGRLERAGLVTRTPDAGDRRRVLVTVTGKGRRRIAAFADRLGDYFAAGEPLLKETYQLLGWATPEPGAGTAANPLVAASAMARAGATFVDDVTTALEPFGITEFADRFALALIFLAGQQRPSRLAEELGFTLSGTSALLTRLESAGLITRRHDAIAGDRRAVQLELTLRGEEAVGVQLDTFARHAPELAGALRLTWPG
jgi:DNA-binding MarR family transcriptional regulator